MAASLPTRKLSPALVSESSRVQCAHARPPMAQDRMDPLGGLLGAGLLDAVRSAEPPVLLRSWEFPPGYRTLVRELFDCFLAGQRSAFVSDAIHGRSGRCAGDGTSRDRRHRVHVRSRAASVRSSPGSVSLGYAAAAALGHLATWV